jgi:hypothetical protein
LLRLQVQLDARYIGHLVLNAFRDEGGAQRTVAVVPQIDEESAAVQRRVGAVDANIRGE